MSGINIRDLIARFAPSYTPPAPPPPPPRTPSATKTEAIDALTFGEHHVGETYLSFVGVLLSAFHPACELDRKVEAIAHFLQTNNINRHLNKRKLLSLIKNNAINNELALFLSGYMECNIWLFYQENRVFKVYYLEPDLDPHKDNVVLRLGRVNDTTQVGYQLGRRDSKKRFSLEDMQGLMAAYLRIPIGLQENKAWRVASSAQDNPLYLDLDPAQCLAVTQALDCPDDEDDGGGTELPDYDEAWLDHFLQTFDEEQLLEEFRATSQAAHRRTTLCAQKAA
jgi:hypothetical protein